MTTAVRSPVTAYAEAVLRGEYVVGNYVRLACERHMRDLETGHERGLRFDEAEAQAAIDYFRILRLHDGAKAGQRFELLPWQEFVAGSIFGWYGSDGTRRFHYAYVEVGRGNGKSPFAAGIGLKGLTADGEQGAQIYSAATTRDQAKVVFDDAWHMAEKSPSLWPRLLKTVNNLAYSATGSYFRPLAAEASKMDGLRVHIALVDELHEHPNGEVLAKLRTGMKSSQPLLFMITTAGYDRHSVCYDEHDYGIRILEGIIEDDSHFAYIAAVDPDDDWTDEACWPKANPSLDVAAVRLATLREECAKAKEIPGQQNAFKRLRLNIWTEQDTRWLDMAVWDKNSDAVDAGALKGRTCYAGLDLSSTTDLTALELYFPDPDAEGGDWLHFYFVPEDNMRKRAERDRVPYEVWVEQGLITATPGNVVDYGHIREKLNSLRDEGYEIQEVGYDPWNATSLVTDLMSDGFECVPIRQGFASLSAPTKEFEKLLLGRKFRGLGHPVARWAASNVMVEQDPAGNIKPSKAKSTERIDPIVAMIEALDRASRHEETDEYVGFTWV